jgi:branched-chain amino acid transport system ATP-binding protein
MLMEVNDLTVRFGGLVAVDSLSFGVDPNEVVCLIGPNGAGKSTVVNALTGLTKYEKGTVAFKGHNLGGLKPNQIARVGLVRSFQNLNSFQNLTVQENVLIGHHLHLDSNLFSQIFRMPKTRRLEKEALATVEEILSFLNLMSVKDSRVVDLPYSQQKMVEVARALAVDPSLLILDEPAAGMNETEKKMFGKYIKRLQTEKGIAIFAIEHDMPFVEHISDRVIAIDFGKKIAEGSFTAVVNRSEVLEAYLGKAVAS